MKKKYLLFHLATALVLIIGFTISAYAVDGCSTTSFKVSSSLAIEAQPVAISVADFNSDGHLDLVALSNTSSQLEILYGRGGAEGFGPPNSIPVGVAPAYVDAGDFNGDSKPDLLITSNGSFSILLNNGSGGFISQNAVSLAGNPYRPVISDLNNDGKLDLLFGLSASPGGNGKVIILLGDGTGGFAQSPSSPLTANGSSVSSILVGDFNEDGKRDLVLASSLTGVDIFIGNGDGSFMNALNSPANTFFSGPFVAGDFNGDGHLDLVDNSFESSFSGSLYVMLGNGAGKFAMPTKLSTRTGTDYLNSRDFDNDGKPDLALTGSSGVDIMLGDGIGGFNAPKTYAIGNGTTAPVFGDFNEDGKIDIAVGQGPNATTFSIQILYNEGGGAFTAPTGMSATIARPTDMVAADFNNDGKQDFATVSGLSSGGILPASSIEVALGDGNGNFTAKPLIRFPGGTLISSIVAADFNKDGKIDLAVTLASHSKVSILLNDGTGGFVTDGFNAPGFATSPYGFGPSKIRAGDFNNDGNLDLAVLTPNSGNFVVMLGDGLGSFTVMQGEPEGTPTDIAVGDFNGDGKLDLITSGSAGNASRVSMFIGSGNGHFTNAGQIEFQQNYIISLLATDLNNDGRPDLAVSTVGTTDFLNASPTDRNVTVILFNSSGVISSRTNYAVDGAGPLNSGDFNGDGKVDIVLSNGQYAIGEGANGISVMTNDGSGLFAAPVSFSAGPASYALAVKDFNGDGKDDVLFTQPLTYTLALLLNNFNGATQQCLSVDDVTVTEGDAGTTNAVFTVKLSAASSQTVRVNYFFEAPYQDDGHPLKKGIDFEDVPGTLTFQPGVTTQTVTVPVKGDIIDEFDEFFNIRLSTPINAVISDSKGVCTIIDDDPPPTISINDVSVAEGNPSSISTATFTVSLSVPSEKPVTVQYALAPGTATSNTDYSTSSGTLEFPIDTASKTISVPLTPDNIFESDETFFINLSNATNATIADAQGQATIVNDDPQPSISIDPVTYPSEGAAGSSINGAFVVKLSNPSDRAITVAYATTDGTATAGSDYTAVSGTLTFNPGETTKNITVQVIGDNTDEIDETFFVNLSNPTNSTVSNGQGTGTILDDDGPLISINDVTITEGDTGTADANFTVTLSAASPQDVSVRYATSAFTATSGVDYQRTTNTLLIPAGATSGTIIVKIIGDYEIEPDEGFAIVLSSPVHGGIADGIGVCTIVNDDAPGTIQFSAQTYNVGEGEGSATVTVTRTSGVSGSVTVDYSTANGTASAGIDYISASGTLTFKEGEISKTFPITIINDAFYEGDETIGLTLSNPTGGATLGSRTTAQLTITDDDSQIQFSQPSYSVAEAAGNLAVTVNRTDTTVAANVDYSTSDISGLTSCNQATGNASSRCDYASTVGTLRFAVGENSKTIFIPVVDDGYVEGAESFTIKLSNPSSGTILGANSSATITITDNDAATSNPIVGAPFFVRQQYIDFLGREPDPEGFAGWQSILNNCAPGDASCDRIAVSSGFFRSPEFQDRGSFIFRFYAAALGRNPSYSEFMPDLARVSGFLSDAQLEANKVAFVQEFMARTEFVNKYGSLSNVAFVDTLIQTSGLSNHPLRQTWIDLLNNGTATRAGVLRAFTESAEVYNKFYNQVFVVMQYFGYLRRDPDASYLQWIQIMNSNGGDYRGMISGFMNSNEYVLRFGP